MELQQWCRLASRLKISVTEAMNTLSCRELILFNKMEEIELKEHSKQDYYLANIAFTIASCFSDEKLKLQDFLIDFSTPTPMTDAERLKNSLACWEAATGKKAVFKDD